MPDVPVASTALRIPMHRECEVISPGARHKQPRQRRRRGWGGGADQLAAYKQALLRKEISM